MKTILIFLASLITVYCVGCANGCSGHGTCSKERECTCFRQQGLGLNNGDFEDFGWTGADCSQRIFYCFITNHSHFLLLLIFTT